MIFFYFFDPPPAHPRAENRRGGPIDRRTADDDVLTLPSIGKSRTLHTHTPFGAIRVFHTNVRNKRALSALLFYFSRGKKKKKSLVSRREPNVSPDAREKHIELCDLLENPSVIRCFSSCE